MLKGISSLLSPELLKILMEMGHSDEIVLADGNFPAASHAQRLVRCDGHGIPELLDAILPLFPLDVYVDRPVALMASCPAIRSRRQFGMSTAGSSAATTPRISRFRRSRGLPFTNGPNGRMRSSPPGKKRCTPT